MREREQGGAVAGGLFEPGGGERTALLEVAENLVLDPRVGLRLLSPEEAVVALERAGLQHPEAVQLLVKNRRREVVVDRRIVRLGPENSLVGGGRLVVFEIEVVVVARGAVVRRGRGRHKKDQTGCGNSHPDSQTQPSERRLLPSNCRGSKKNWVILKS